MSNPNYPRPPFEENKLSFKEPNNSTEFGSDLAPKTREFLTNYNYLGICSREIAASEVPPGVLFFTADIKLPENGEAKLLEFNGVGSQLEAYPEGQNEPARRIYNLLDSLDRPVTVLSPVEEDQMSYVMQIIFAELSRRSGNPLAADYKPGIHNDLIGYDMESAQKLGIKYDNDPKPFKPKRRNIKTKTDLRTVDGVVWLQSDDETLWDIDTNRFAVINPKRFNEFIDEKSEFDTFFKEHHLEFARPKSWLLTAKKAKEAAQAILKASEGVERFILKPSGLTGGKGIELIKRADFLKRIRELFVEPFDYDQLLGGDRVPQEGFLRKLSKPFVVEEYVPSKPILSSKTEQEYDGTMRVALMTVTNNEKATLVPICSYWKLPSNPLSEKWDKQSAISTVHLNTPSEMVSPEDFKRGFDTLTKIIPEMLRGITIESNK